ncbi:MAG: stage III sporulation protein AE, partial [Clostridia bacterium]|nr:stage III sporulation protein AE [Clostridia bacterium]
FLLVIVPSATNHSFYCYATDEAIEDVISEGDIEDEISDQLDDLDFSELDKILENFTSNQSSIFGSSSFIEKLKQLISGDFDDGQSLFQGIINVFFESLLSLLPSLSIIIAISLLGNMIQGIKPTSNGKSLSNIIHFVTYGVVVVLVLSIVIKMISLATGTLTTIQNQMNSIFPILLTLLTAIGGTSSVSVYQPAMALLTNGILNLFTYILLPLFIFSVVFSIISNLSNSVKLDKFTSFCNSTFKWIVGLVFTIFTAFLSLQGITAGSMDGISIRTAKYAIRSYVPILGSYLSDGMSLILVSSNIIKNAVGAGGLFLMLASILSPLIEMIIFMLALKLIAGIVEPLGNKQIANFVSSLSKSMVLLIVILIGVAFVYFILIGLVMCSANIA